MRTFTFDVKLFTTLRIEAESEAAARHKLAECEVADLQLIQPSKAVFLSGESSIDGFPDLVEIDGRAV